MHRRRVRRWATRVVLAAVFGAAALGAFQGASRLIHDVVWVADVVWFQNGTGGSGEGP